MISLKRVSVTIYHSNLLLKVIIIYIQYLTTAAESLLYGAVVGTLDIYPGRPGLNPTIGAIFFSYASVFCYDFYVATIHFQSLRMGI